MKNMGGGAHPVRDAEPDYENECCACLRVVYDPIHVGELNRDSWSCKNCGGTFARTGSSVRRDKRIAELEACLGDSQEGLTVADERITYLETMLDRAMTALGRGKDE